MSEPRPYKSTLTDRYGPDAGGILQSVGLGCVAGAITLGMLMLAQGFSFRALLISITAGAASTLVMLGLSGAAGGAYQRLMMSGASTPAVEQFSYQEALVMQGRLDDALASFEAVIAEEPGQITARIRAAELYLRDNRNVQRAVELLKQAQQAPGIAAGQDIYVSNRIADLLAGPLHKPGAALVELRRLVDRHPTLPAAAHARDAIARIKATLLPAEDVAT